MRSEPSVKDFFVLLACAAGAALLYCLRFGFEMGGLLHAAGLALFAVPVALVAAIVFAYPVLLVLRMRDATHPLAYIAAPAVLMLLLCMAPILLPGPYSVLNEGGYRLIAEGRPVWANLGWIALYSGEPALWAGLAGLAFWWFRVRARRSSPPPSASRHPRA